MNPRVERWTVLATIAAAGLLIAYLMMPPRYEVHVVDGAIFRLDRWSGRVDVSRLNTLKQAPWVTLVLSEKEQEAETRKLVDLLSAPADEKKVPEEKASPTAVAPPKTGTARFEDIQSIQPPPTVSQSSSFADDLAAVRAKPPTKKK
jgi:hypothetical protein